MIGVLREETEGGDPAAAADAPPTCPALIEEARAAGMRIEAEIDAAGDGSTAARAGRTPARTAYRIVQEGLTNARKHAPDGWSGPRRAGDGALLEVELRNPQPVGAALGPARPSRRARRRVGPDRARRAGRAGRGRVRPRHRRARRPPAARDPAGVAAERAARRRPADPGPARRRRPAGPLRPAAAARRRRRDRGRRRGRRRQRGARRGRPPPARRRPDGHPHAGLDGIAAAGLLAGQPSPPAVIILTTFDADELVLRALRAGAAGFLLKDTPPAEIVRAIETVAAGRAQLSPAVTRRLIELRRRRRRTARPRRARGGELVDRLSPREREVAGRSAAASPTPRSRPSSTSASPPSRPTSPSCWRSSRSTTGSRSPCWSTTPPSPDQAHRRRDENRSM